MAALPWIPLRAIFACARATGVLRRGTWMGGWMRIRGTGIFDWLAGLMLWGSRPGMGAWTHAFCRAPRWLPAGRFVRGMGAWISYCLLIFKPILMRRRATGT